MVRSVALVAALSALAFGGVACGQRQLSDTEETSAAASGGAETTAESTSESTTVTIEQTTDLAIASDLQLVTASNRYRDYVVEQVALLNEETGKFTRAVEAGNVEEAKELYPAARVPWERIEPVAAALGDYDPAIDAREGDVPEDEWTGFHPIEQALWIEDTTEGQEENAVQLREDVGALQEEVEGLEVTPVDLVTGSVELLNEVSVGKITGEEERYSHIDLYDFQANLEGSEMAFELLTPSLEKRDPELIEEVRGRFDDVYSQLEQYREGEDGWVSYEEVSEDERQEISQTLDALAEPLSQVGSVLEDEGSDQNSN